MKLEMPEDFEDVAIEFSTDEWTMLNKDEKKLHREVMVQNFEHMVSLGYSIPLQQLLFLLGRQEEHSDGSADTEETEDSEMSDSAPDIYRRVDYSMVQSSHSSVKDHIKLENDEIFPDQIPITKHGMFHMRSQYNCMEYGKGFGHNVKQTNQLETQGKYADYKNGYIMHGSLTTHQQFHCEENQKDSLAPIQTVHGENLYKCATCGKCFGKKRNLARHKKIHLRNKPYMHSTNDTALVQNNVLGEHQAVHSEGNPCKCEACNNRLGQLGTLGQHKIHTTLKLFKCPKCPKRFSQRSSMYRHQKIHRAEKFYNCTTCNMSFMLKHNLQQHEQIHIGDKPYKCATCDQTFTQKGSLMRHLNIHTGVKLYKCATCNRGFTRKSSMLRHQNIHVGEKPFRCTVCDKSFLKRRNLVRHVKRHSGKKLYSEPMQDANSEQKNILEKPENTKTEENPAKSMSDNNFSEIDSFGEYKNIDTSADPYTFTKYAVDFLIESKEAQYQTLFSRTKPFNCSACDMGFKKRHNLLQHELTHTGEKPYKCSVCNTDFARKSSMVRHQKRHIGEKLFKYSMTERSFAQKYASAILQNMHTKQKPYIYSALKKRLRKRGILTEHNNIYTVMKPHKCASCDKSFVQRSSLIRHKKIHASLACDTGFTLKVNDSQCEPLHTGESLHKCTTCDKSFIHKSSMIRHLNIHTCEKLYKCALCGRTFTRRSSMIRHQKIHTGEKSYTCVTYSRFRQKTGIRMLKKMYTGLKPYKCATCDRRFRLHHNLRQHEKIHTGDLGMANIPTTALEIPPEQLEKINLQEKPYKCSICGRGFRLKCNLCQHERLHSGERPYKCTLCDRRFMLKLNLRQHENMHTGEKPYKCATCHRSFRLKHNLVQHERIHTGDTGTGPKTATALEAHPKQLENVNIEEKPYKCTLCGRGFRLKCNLMQHEQIHTGVKPYKCNTCDRRFRLQHNLIQHERIHICNSEAGFASSLALKSTPEKQEKINSTEEPQSFPCDSSFKLHNNLGHHEGMPTGNLERDCIPADALETPLIEVGKESLVEKPYKCTTCDRRFRLKHNLMQHERIHTGNSEMRSSLTTELESSPEKMNLEKPYKCSKCDRWFRLKHNLMQHEQIHVGDLGVDLFPIMALDETSEQLEENLYKCTICDASFSMLCDLLQHEQLHTSEFGMGSIPTIALENHEKLLPEQIEVRLKCNLSQYQQMLTMNFEQGSTPALQTNTEEQEKVLLKKPYKCTICDRSFTLKCNLCQHERLHTGERPFKCTICDRRFMLKLNLRQHERMHTGEKPYKCITCDRRFRLKHNLVQHERIHTGKTEMGSILDVVLENTPKKIKNVSLVEKPYKCNTFDRSVDLKLDLMQHEETHTRSTEIGLFPDLALEIPPEQVQKVNLGEKPYKCSICDRGFRMKCNLSQHQRIHTAKLETVSIPTSVEKSPEELEKILLLERPYKCSICGRHFRLKCNLILHERLHTGERPFKCTICDKRFMLKLNLRQHERMHTGETPHRCSVCHRSFWLKCNLRQHELTHTSDSQMRPIPATALGQGPDQVEKPYKCGTCDRRFRLKHNLKQHERIHIEGSGIGSFPTTPVNLEEKPYKCSICDRRFRMKGNLSQHEQMHTDIKPHKCATCNRRFRLKHNLIQHERIHTGVSGRKPIFTEALENTHEKMRSEMVSISTMALENNEKTEVESEMVSVSTVGLQSTPVKLEKVDMVEKPYENATHDRSFDQQDDHLQQEQTQLDDSQAVSIYTVALKNTPEKLEELNLEGRPYKCTICDRRFRLKHNLMQHEIIHTRNSPKYSEKSMYHKKMGSIPATELENLPKELEKANPIDKICEYNTCDKSFEMKYNTIQLEQTQMSDGLFPAMELENSPKQVKEVNLVEKPYKCIICDRGFRMKCNLSQHQRIHTADLETKSIPTTHLHKKPGKVEKAVPVKKQYKCSICGRRFRLKCNLVLHERLHTGERPFKCGLCDRRFMLKLNLRQHERMHTGEKPYKCDTCHRSFWMKCNLKQHEQIHSGDSVMGSIPATALHKSHEHLEKDIVVEKPYKCGTCDRRFRLKHNLRQHERIHIEGSGMRSVPTTALESPCKQVETNLAEKPYKCTICDRRFRMKGNLSQHEQMHTDEKPHKCATCNRRFRLKHNLIQHERIHTNVSKILPLSTLPLEKNPEKIEKVNSEMMSVSTVVLENTAGKTEEVSSEVASVSTVAFKNTPEKMEKVNSEMVSICTLTLGNTPEKLEVIQVEKPYKCTTCDRRFRLKHNLLQHERIHTGGSQVTCLHTTAMENTPLKLEKVNLIEKQYKCTTCDRRFRMKHNLMQHVRIHGSGSEISSFPDMALENTPKKLENVTLLEKTYESSPCDRHSITEHNVLQHDKAHFGDTGLGKLLPMRLEMPPGQMEKVNMEENPLTYDLIQHEKTSTGNAGLGQLPAMPLEIHHKHVAEVSLGEKPYKCTICDRTFRMKCNLSQHQRIHTADLKVGSVPTTHLGKKRDQQENTVLVEKPYKCSICGRYFRLKCNLILHERLHTGERPFKCTICDRRFMLKLNLRQHERMHTGEKPHNCSTCHRSFWLQCNLRQHEQKHIASVSSTELLKTPEQLEKINLVEKPHKCIVCDRRFRLKHNLRQHEKIHTVVSVPDTALGTSPEQMEKVNLVERPYKCSWCDRCFRLKCNRSQHERIHIEEKPYKCSTCGKSFRLKHNLWQHERIHGVYLERGAIPATVLEKSPKQVKKVNLGEKPHKCTICGRGFRMKCNLAQHEHIHTKEKPYKCTKCDRRFRLQHNLRQHQQIHTVDLGNRHIPVISLETPSEQIEQVNVLRMPYKCVKCDRSFELKNNFEEHECIHTGESVVGPCPPMALEKNSEQLAKVNMREKPHKCTTCERRFRLKHNLIQHERVHTGKSRMGPIPATALETTPEQQLEEDLGEIPYKCATCGKRFSMKHSLWQHEKMHTRDFGIGCTPPVKLEENFEQLEDFNAVENPYKCATCGKTFEKRRNLLRHEKLHVRKNTVRMGDSSYSNIPSNKTFRHRFGFLEHKKIHTRLKLYKCIVCEKAFRQKSSLARHQKIHTGEKPFKCSMCAMSFRLKFNLRQHEPIHTGEKLYHCSTCDKSFIQKSSMVRHQKVHTGVEYVDCPMCEKRFSQKSSMVRHQKIHAGEKSCVYRSVKVIKQKIDSRHFKTFCTSINPYKCAMCGKSFKLKHHLRQHLDMHVGEKINKCATCGKGFRLIHHLRQHEQMHVGMKLYKCATCEKTFRLKHHLRQHEQIHVGIKLYKCATCEKSFGKRRNLVRHEKIHGGKTLYKLPTSEESFTENSGLLQPENNHNDSNCLAELNSSVKPCESAMCSEPFIVDNDLKHHKNTNTEVKQFKCETCGKCFRLKCLMTRHQRIHTSEKIYKCALCNRSFKLKHNLRQHEQKHMIQKRHKCDTCGKSFTRRSSLVRHQKAHNEEHSLQASEVTLTL